jgi:hypothetical protein
MRLHRSDVGFLFRVALLCQVLSNPTLSRIAFPVQVPSKPSRIVVSGGIRVAVLHGDKLGTMTMETMTWMGTATAHNNMNDATKDRMIE